MTLAATLRRLLQRPRFPLEGAFALTFLWTLFFGLPTSINVPAEAAPLRLVDAAAVQQRLAAGGADLERGMNRLPRLLDEGVTALGDAGRRLLPDGMAVTPSGSDGAWRNIRRWIDDFEFPLNRDLNE